MALVATADGVAVVDTNVMDANKPVELLGVLGNGALGLSGSHRPSAIAILPDDSRAYVAVRGSPWEPADEVLVVDLADLISGTFDASVVTKRIDTGWDTNPSAIAESPDGQFVAVACPNINTVAIISTATDEIYDVSPGTSRLHLSVPLSQNPSEYPTSITWAEDNDTVYVGFLSGYLGGALDTSGAVRKCEISAGRCWHEVGVSGPVRGVTVRGKGADRVVWVADDLGYITPLQDYLFIPSSSTSGVDTYGLLDGTGGCIEVRGSHPFDKNIAIPCEPAVRVGSGDFLSGIASY